MCLPVKAVNKGEVDDLRAKASRVTAWRSRARASVQLPPARGMQDGRKSAWSVLPPAWKPVEGLKRVLQSDPSGSL